MGAYNMLLPNASRFAEVGKGLLLSALFVPAILASTIPDATPSAELVVTRRTEGAVLTINSNGAEGKKYGFEGGRVIKIKGTYHLFTSEMIGDPRWVKMRLAHWVSQDRLLWKRLGTLAESSGDFTSKDPHGALWSPLPVYDPKDKRWNLFYVAYQSAPDTARQWLTNHEGRIWRAVSTIPRVDGIGGPYSAGTDFIVARTVALLRSISFSTIFLKAKMRHLNEIECFVKAVELKSLTAAAKALKLPKSKIRSKIKTLEERELHDLPDAVVSSFMRDARRVSRALAG